jgi:hypothetical protein
MFNHDWFHGPAFQEQQSEARYRCTLKHFPDAESESQSAAKRKKLEQFNGELEVRSLIYLRDGFSYEIRQIAEVGSKSHLVFECTPVDEHYKVGAFVVSVPFDEIVRVEAFAVHPDEKPEDFPQITGFRSYPEAMEPKPTDGKPPKPPRPQS